MNGLFGAALTCAMPALVWLGSQILHNAAIPIGCGLLALPPISYPWIAELRAWRRGQTATPFAELEEVKLLGTLLLAVALFSFGVAGILNLLGVLHWAWLPT